MLVPCRSSPSRMLKSTASCDCECGSGDVSDISASDLPIALKWPDTHAVRKEGTHGTWVALAVFMPKVNIFSLHAGSLRLASTSETGDVAVFRVDEPDAPGSRPTYTPELVLQGAHKDVRPTAHRLPTQRTFLGRTGLAWSEDPH